MNVRFVREARSATSLPSYFANAFKAYIINADCAPSAYFRIGIAAGFLAGAVETRLSLESFRWADVIDADFEAADHLVSSALMTPEHITGQLFPFRCWLRERLNLQHLTWQPPHYYRPESSDAKRKAAPLASIEALAKIYSTFATDPIDRFVSCLVGLLFLTGCRLTEILSLPYDCLVEEPQTDGSVRVGIRYWERKSGNDSRYAQTRWLSPLGGDLARAFIVELRDLTLQVRAFAKRLEDSPDRVPMPWAAGSSSVVSAQEFGRAFGKWNASYRTRNRAGNPVVHVHSFTSKGSGYSSRRISRTFVLELARQYGVALSNADTIPAYVKINPAAKLLGKTAAALNDVFYRALAKDKARPNVTPETARAAYVTLAIRTDSAAVSLELVRRRGSLTTIALANGDRQMLSATLPIIFSEKRRFTPTEHTFDGVRCASPGDVQLFLASGPRKNRSAFRRLLKIGDTRAAELEINPHSLRHFMNSLAHRAGMSILQISLWMRRSDPSQTVRYIHSLTGVIDLTREGLSRGILVGSRQREFLRLPLASRPVFLASLTSAHQMEACVCTLPSGPQECERQKICEGCPFSLFRRDSPADLAARQRRLARYGGRLKELQLLQQEGIRVEPQQVSMLQNAMRFLQRLDA